jgi:ABC-2 type transport system permease protein
MKNILAVYRRELGGYFVSPIAYIVVGLFLVVCGFFFYNILTSVIEYSFRSQMQAARMGGPSEMDVPGMVMRGFFGNTSVIILIMIPMLTMGIYAEERKRGTMELLMTSPLSEFQIVIGKFLAALTLFFCMLAPTFLYIVVMGLYSEPSLSWTIVLSGYLGLFLLGAFLVAIGAFISSLTENQIIAAVATFSVFILLWVLDFGTRDSTTTMGEILQYVSVLRHFEDFSRGVIDTSSVVFYLSMVALGIFLTLRTLDSMRWRRA